MISKPFLSERFIKRFSFLELIGSVAQPGSSARLIDNNFRHREVPCSNHGGATFPKKICGNKW